MANTTIRLRPTAVRLFYDHLIEEGVQQNNPVGRGRYIQSGGFGRRPTTLSCTAVHHPALDSNGCRMETPAPDRQI